MDMNLTFQAQIEYIRTFIDMNCTKELERDGYSANKRLEWEDQPVAGTRNALHDDSCLMATSNSKRMPPPTGTPLVARGATARSVASPRLNPATTSRRPPAKSASPVPPASGESHEALSASLKLETDKKEQVCLLPLSLGPEII